MNRIEIDRKETAYQVERQHDIEYLYRIDDGMIIDPEKIVPKEVGEVFRRCFDKIKTQRMT